MSTQAEISQMVKRYKKGDSLRTIAKEFGICYVTVRGYLLSNGVTMRSRGQRPLVTPAKALEMRAKGMTNIEIAAKLKVSAGAVSRACCGKTKGEKPVDQVTA